MTSKQQGDVEHAALMAASQTRFQDPSEKKKCEKQDELSRGNRDALDLDSEPTEDPECNVTSASPFSPTGSSHPLTVNQLISREEKGKEGSSTKIGANSWLPADSVPRNNHHSPSFIPPAERGFSAEEDAESIDSIEPPEPVEQPWFSCCVNDEDRCMWDRQPPRQHAFKKPLHLFQCIALGGTLFGFLCFWFCIIPGYGVIYRDGYKAALGELLIFGILMFVLQYILFHCWLVVSFFDSTDYGIFNGVICVYCRRRTRGNSKHCKACNKCVIGFDHHCKWLNMCIGSQTYRYFMGYLTSALLLLLIGLVSSIALLAQWWHQLGKNSAYFQVVPFFLILLTVAGLPPVLNLFCFHIKLNLLGMTTYEYIMEKRRKKALRE